MLTMPQLQRALREETQRLEDLVKEIRLLINGDAAGGSINASGGSPSATAAPNQYFGMKACQAIDRYLLSKGAPATREELADVTTRGGAKMGKYPKRTVAEVVRSGVNSRRLEESGELVSLREAYAEMLRGHTQSF